MTTETDEFLAHYGVAGMKWGKRRAGSTSTKTRSELRALDKATVKTDRAQRKADWKAHKVRTNADIDAARARYKESARKDLKAAKAQYNKDKYDVGKKEAVKALRTVKNNNAALLATAQQTKYGKEQVSKALTQVLGSVLLATLSPAR